MTLDTSRLLTDQDELLDFVRERRRLHELEPERLHPWFFRRCTIDVLLVTDGSLDFGSADFGLRTFVKTIQSAASFTTRFRVTLAHRRDRSGDAMLEGDTTIHRRIVDFRFDDPDHFSAEVYDQAWMFGIESSPPIADSEVRAVAEFMDAGNGVFATGDHAALGRAMGEQIPRVRSMRLWDSTPGVDEVSMGGHRRNDTNRIGHDAGSQFDDQSDDIPQVVTPRRYRTRVGIWEAVYPHPLLCSPTGTITVMPDHPHEGECVEPTDLSQTVALDGTTFIEYPAATGGGTKPRPEVISTSRVLSGTTSGTKAATQGHHFGGICAYDGHRAGVGRVVTDATWHHFVNINLVGDIGKAPPKDAGFLDSAVGTGHLEQIRTYYRNIAVWISPAALIRCINRRLLWWTIFQGRVVEAVATTDRVELERAHPQLLWHIGKQARDVLGRRTGTCQQVRLVLDLLLEQLPEELLVRIDPWGPIPDPTGPDPVPWFDPTPLLDMALGGAVLAIHEGFADEREVDADRLDEVLDDVARKGASRGLELARGTAKESVEVLSGYLRAPTDAR